MMRKFYALVVLAAVMAGLWSGAAFASYWDEGNDGDSWETAYIIDSVEDFMQMLNNTNGETGKYYKLTIDLDLTSETDFSGQTFSGHFDGQNHTVKVNISGDYSASLFYNIDTDGTAIRNLNVEGSVRANMLAGGIAGYLTQGTIENCTFTGEVEAVNTESRYSRAGGIVVHLGVSDSGKVESAASIVNCKFQGTVNSSTSYRADGGGIAGVIYYGTIDRCTVLAGSEIFVTTSPDMYSEAGGIAGFVGESIGGNNIYGTVYITNCTSYAQVSGNRWIGGIAGVSDLYNMNVHFSGNTWPQEYSETGNGSADSDTPAPESADLPVGYIMLIPLSDDVLGRIAQTLSIDASQLRTLSDSNITAPQEPSQAMTDYVKSDNHEIIGKLDTISVDVRGWYVFTVSLTDELYELVKDKSTSDFKFYALNDEDSPQVSASILNGLLGTWEVFSLTGEKLDTFGVREFLMVGMLEASKPLSLYIAKILLMLLAGGCSVKILGAVPILLAGLVILTFRKH